MHVKDIMKKKIITVDKNQTVRAACDKYRDFKVGSLVVTHEENVVGMLTERDVIERTICTDKNPNTTKVNEIMTENVTTIDSYDTIEEALEIIKNKKIKKLPVVTNNKLVGIITITDIAYTRPSVRNFLEISKK